MCGKYLKIAIILIVLMNAVSGSFSYFLYLYRARYPYGPEIVYYYYFFFLKIKWILKSFNNQTFLFCFLCFSLFMGSNLGICRVIFRLLRAMN